MSYNFDKPFDERLQVVTKNEIGDYDTIIPVSGKKGTNAYSYLMPLETMDLKASNYSNGKVAAYKKIVDKQRSEIKTMQKNTLVHGLQPSIMNPYAMLHLSGGLDASGNTRIIDKRSSDNITWGVNDENYNNPTTHNIINWGKNNNISGRTPYLFQDFVFCKWWNKIPNNRMITLRRYSNPVLDNLQTPADGLINQDNNIDLKAFPPMATAITYFGEDTGNNLKDILKFSTGYNWGEAKADIWDLSYTTGKEPTTNEQLNGALGAIGLQYGDAIAKIMNLTSLWTDGPNSNPNIGFEEGKAGMPPDPYVDGPYTNRIQGPVNRIDSVKKREAGIKFEMGGLKIKFSYLARPIGGINSKAVMLDILSNFMIMGSASAVFFGGAHRNRIPGVRFPASKSNVIQALYNGNITGKDGAIARFSTNISSAVNKFGGVPGVISTMFDTAKSMLGDLLNSLGLDVDFLKDDDSTDTKDEKEKKAELKRRTQKAIADKMKTGMAIPYVQGMRAILTGEPVGEWHLTIGNPMNPIAMIGNLICTNMEIEIDEDAGLGPDDFPLGWNITISLEHGMARDRDAIESMFNFGNGRIYELPDDFIGSADFVTKVDKYTQDMSKGDDIITINLRNKDFITPSNNSIKKANEDIIKNIKKYRNAPQDASAATINNNNYKDALLEKRRTSRPSNDFSERVLPKEDYKGYTPIKKPKHMRTIPKKSVPWHKKYNNDGIKNSNSKQANKNNPNNRLPMIIITNLNSKKMGK